jgi:3-hydroxyisobutyrate dehydrogenase-like beta-hydroxyacid dehydrogenase
MQKPKLGILHPGNMGVSVAASAQNSGCEVYWASEGRSAQTRRCADKCTLHDAGTVAVLCQTCSVMVCVCPPHAAEDVAEKVLSHGFAGLYLDANAISPQRAVRIGERMRGAGVSFVDGGIVGPPAWEPNSTWLYLSGRDSAKVADYFCGGPLETTVVGEGIGKASALKMCYSAWTKGSTALLCAILATAQALDVWDELEQRWERNWPGFAEEAVGRTRRVTAKAWRFAGEMEEISATFAEAGLPGGFHAAAAEVYRRMAHLKDAPSTACLEEVLSGLVRRTDR